VIQQYLMKDTQQGKHRT